MPNGAGRHKDDFLVAVLSFRGCSEAEHIFCSNFVQHHLKARCGQVVAFINYYLSVILNNRRNRVVLLVYQTLICGYINDPGGLFLSSSDDADLGLRQKRA